MNFEAVIETKIIQSKTLLKEIEFFHRLRAVVVQIGLLVSRITDFRMQSILTKLFLS